MQEGEGSSPTTQNFFDYFGKCGIKKGTHQLLKYGTYPPSLPSNKYETAFLNHGQSTQYQKTFYDSPISTNQFIRIFDKTKETTASSPSGIHIGNYKVATHHPILTEILSLQMSLPFKYGFSVPHWKKSLHVMIEKIPEIKNITQMLIIKLVEEDYNAALKILMTSYVNNTLNNNLLSNDMHGGLPKHRTHDAILSQQFMIDNIKQTKNGYFN